jgi:hypothetical protein
MAHPILATAMESINWLRGTIDASTYLSSLPPEGTDVAMNPAAPNPMLLRPLSEYTVKTIWENKTSMAGIILGLLIIFVINYTRSPWRKLPPSPRRMPIFGNALQLRDKSWLLSKDCKERFGEFYRLYTQVDTKVSTDIAGEIMYLDGAGQPVVVCNSLKSAFEIFERRSANYSDRSRFVMAQEILSGGLLFSLMNYDDRWLD